MLIKFQPIEFIVSGESWSESSNLEQKQWLYYINSSIYLESSEEVYEYFLPFTLFKTKSCVSPFCQFRVAILVLKE